MKKILLALCVLIAVSFTVRAQTTGGPDAYGYIWRTNLDPQGPAYNWVEIDGLTETIEVVGLTDDNVIPGGGFINLNVPFHFYWYDVSGFRVGSNGYLTFSTNTNLASSTSCNGFCAIPTPGGGDDYIGALVSDLLFSGTAARCYYLISTDSLIVTFDSVPFWDAAGPVGYNTFQIILDYTDSSIVFNYKDQNGLAGGTNFMSIGIENNSGTVGLQYLYNVYPPAGSAVKFYPPATTTLQINDASTVYNDNPDNGAVFISKNGDPFVMTTEVANTGNQPLAAFNVLSQVRNSANLQIVADTFSAGPLTPGQTQFITQTNTFVAPAAGQYTFRTDTQLPADATPSNNRKDVELEVIDTTLASIELQYEYSNTNASTVSWTGGDGGVAVYMKPSFTPYIITDVKEFVTSDANSVGYHMMVYDDDGLNGAPGTLLDSVYVPPATFTLGAWTTTPLNTPIMKTSGGFYVLWYMGGDGVSLGTQNLPPISNRTYEVLVNSSASSFAVYRERQTEEVMLRALISQVVGIEDQSEMAAMFSNIYPNPTAGQDVHFNFDLSAAASQEFTVDIFDLHGRMIRSDSFDAEKGTVTIPVMKMQEGIYVCRIHSNGSDMTRRFTIIH
jgi:hypothetical protein